MSFWILNASELVEDGAVLLITLSLLLFFIFFVVRLLKNIIMLLYMHSQPSQIPQ